ncbi:SsgA family sporulation/cell division regulator [Streptomyces flaveolus]|uniref:SsgA family sporulation/cell division regulator n=1 Tax=Streptomyces flaveolus TaxID=67297 RepID=UPI0036FB7D0C
MTVRKDDPMDHLAAADEEFDALLEASSLGAPHVVAETGDIPATARRRMKQAAHHKRLPLSTPDDAGHPQTDDEPDTSLQTEPAAQKSHSAPSWPADGLFALPVITSKMMIAGALLASLRSASTGRSNRGAGRSWMTVPTKTPTRSALWLMDNQSLRRDALLPYTRHGDSRITPWPWRRVPSGNPLPAARNTLGETQAAFSCMLAGMRETQPHSPDITAPSSFAPQALSPVAAWRSWQRLHDSRQPADPWEKPGGALMRATLTGLLLLTVPPTPLHIERFTTYAYRTSSDGLLVPKTTAATKHASQAQERETPEHDSRRPARRDRAKLRRATVDGTAELSAELPMLVHFDECESLALASSLHARLIYRASDPYAVEARFRADGQDETVWIFARDLLKKGLDQRNGLGDVVVWPDADLQEEPRVFIRLSSPEGTALLSVADTGLRAFLKAASKLIAFGEEHAHLLPALNALETTMGELARPGRCE